MGLGAVFDNDFQKIKTQKSLDRKVLFWYDFDGWRERPVCRGPLYILFCMFFLRKGLGFCAIKMNSAQFAFGPNSIGTWSERAFPLPFLIN